MEFKAVHIECLIPQNDRHRQIYSHMSEVDGSLLLCLDWIYGLPFTMGKWFLTDNSSMVGRILMISSADHHDILIMIRWWKNSPLAHLQARARKICIMCIVDFDQFWPFFAQKCFGFCVEKFFPVWGNTWNFQGSISTARATFEPKTPTYYPIFFWPKMGL